MDPILPTADEIDARVPIDRSCRVPVIFFYSSGLAWLMISLLLGLLVSWKLLHPGFLADCDMLTYGRLYPAYWSAVIYGFASQLGIGTAIWLMARLSRSKMKAPWITMIAGKFWNVGVVIGILSILFGNGTSMPWLDFPGYAAVILLVAFAMFGVWTLMMFADRKTEVVYISQWYLIAAFFGFPWIYIGSNVLLFAVPTKGVSLALVNAWFMQGMIWSWFVPLGLAAIYYLIPKITGKTIAGYSLATMSFWALLFFSSCTAPSLLIGGPIPVWLQTVGIAACILLVVPVVTIGINFQRTIDQSSDKLTFSPSLRFAMVGALAFVAAGIVQALFAFRYGNQMAHFTMATPGLFSLFIFGFFGMSMFASIYFILPRVIACEWCSTTLIKWHFWLTFYGLAIYLGAQIFGGLAEGVSLQNVKMGLEQVNMALVPYIWLGIVATVLILFAQFIFCCHFLLMILQLIRSDRDPVRMTQPRAASPSLEAVKI